MAYLLWVIYELVRINKNILHWKKRKKSRVFLHSSVVDPVTVIHIQMNDLKAEREGTTEKQSVNKYECEE